MGRALAAILEREVSEPGDELRPFLDPGTTELPPFADVRALLESSGVDVDTALAAARGDGDLFEGDELRAGEVIASSGRLLEAVGPGATSNTTRYRVAVIRPGRAQGYSRRYYSTRMLEANAGNFGGQPVFWNHEDLDVILKRGHGSRDPRDLCGWLQEATTWDPNYTEPNDAAEGRERGAVMGEIDVNSDADELLSTFPQALALSINMDSTKVKVGRTAAGGLAPLVEGVVKGSGSLDLITGKAGAGGKVLDRLRESASLPYHPAHEDLADVPSDRLLEAVRARPELAEHLREAGNPIPEGSVSAIDPGKLVEALGDPAVKSRIVEALAGDESIDRLVEAKFAEREDEIRADAVAESQRGLDLRDFRDDAHRLIESKALGQPGGILTPAYIEDLKARYMLREGQHPTPGLDVHDVLGEDGAVEKAARDVLVEAVTRDIEREEAKIREANPTRVRGLGGLSPENGERVIEAEETDEQKAAREARERAEAARASDPMAAELGMDPDAVRRYQTSGV